MPEATRWVTDTSVYTHLCRADHADLLAALAPGGIILVPDDVDTEIKNGQALHSGIPDVSAVTWAEVTVLTFDEVMTQMAVKGAMGGGPRDHLGECAVIACAKHRKLIALIGDRPGRRGKRGESRHPVACRGLRHHLRLRPATRPPKWSTTFSPPACNYPSTPAQACSHGPTRRASCPDSRHPRDRRRWAWTIQPSGQRMPKLTPSSPLTTPIAPAYGSQRGGSGRRC